MKKKILVITALLCVACTFLGFGCFGNKTPTYYTVTFTGEGVTEFTQTVEPNGLVINPKAPEREGYLFNGWYNGNTEYVFSNPVTSDLTLVANWTAIVKHTVTLKNGDEVKTLTVTDGETVTQPETPEKSGFEFEGWLYEGALYDFNTPITGDVEITAAWANGTNEYPYLIFTKEDLVDFSNKVNDTSGKYYDKYYSLQADIDMAGVEYTPAGMPVLDSDGYVERYGFSGVFYGNDHVIKNLEQSRLIRNQSGAFYMGLFATTSLAVIKDLHLENVNYEMVSYNPAGVSAYVGGVVAYARLTNFANVSVNGNIVIDMMNDNYVYAGGVVGGLYADTEGGQAYIVYVENCSADIEISVGVEGAFENGAAGGIAGFLQNYSSTVAVINCASSGKVTGGMFTGGLIGSVSNYASIINCYSSAQVQPTATEVSYAGGLIGDISGDSVVADSYASGIVIGKEQTSTTYSSYAGGLIGHAYKDDYEYYYSAGAVIVNSYYSGNLIRNGVIKGDWGTQISSSSVNEDFYKNNLGWLEECWDLTEIKPTSVRICDVKDAFSLSLSSNGTVVESKDMPCDENGYSLIGELGALKNENGKVFFDWEYQENLLYRFYMPVIKDITLTARWQDVSGIVGAYKGEAKLENSGNPINSGSIILSEDGGVQWVQGSVNIGGYIYNGEIIVIEMYNGVGTLYGTLANGNLNFTADAGITGTVYYNFTKYEPLFLGEYISEAGDIITFKDDANLTFESVAIKNGDYVSATYTVSNNILTVSGLSQYFESALMSVDSNGNLVATFTPANGNEYSLNQVTFTKAGKVDYSNKPFIGEYNLVYINSSPTYYNGEEIFRVEYYKLIFNANGTVIYRSEYSDTLGRYYFIESNSSIKMMLDGYMSIFTYDSDLGIIHGSLSRGSTSVLSVVLTPSNQGKLYGYAMGSRANAVFTNGTNYYVVENGTFNKNATVTGKFEHGNTVTVNGKEYYVRYIQAPENASYEYYDLTLIGFEKGRYTYNGKTFELNGFGAVTGGYTGEYQIFNGTVIVLTTDDQIFGFDPEESKKAGGAVTLIEQDGLQGVWYMDAIRYSADGDEFVDNYYKLIVDGYGHSAVYYLSAYGYRLNWGGGSWGNYNAVTGGIYAVYNSSQTVTLYYYYDNAVLYSDASSSWIIKQASFAKAGYEGPLTPPAMPTAYAGSYYNVEDESKQVIFNLKENLTGSYMGAIISKVTYNGKNQVYFTANGINYVFTYGETTCTISGNNQVVTVANGGVVTEIYPSSLVGTWTGVWEGINVNSGEERSIRIQADGFIYYVIYFTGGGSTENVLSGVNYDGVNGVITGYTGVMEFTLTYNAEDQTITLIAKDDESREWTATLIKEA